jgi:WhiB family redox-sensing transcriptional regulator
LIAPDPALGEHEPDGTVKRWQPLALCLGHDPDLWFPTDSDGGARALSICAACAVRVDCLAWALENNEKEGIWGGVSPRKRQRIRAERRRESSPVTPIALATSLRFRDIEAIG